MAAVTSAEARGSAVLGPALLIASTRPSLPYTTTSSAPLSARCWSVAAAQLDGGLSARRFANSCVLPLDWEGRVEVSEQPALDPEFPIVRFHVVDTTIVAKDGRKTFTSRLWDWIKRYVHPRFESVAVDLHTPVEELRRLLPLVLPASYVANADTTLSSVTLADARVEIVADSFAFTPEDQPARLAEIIVRTLAGESAQRRVG